MDRLERAAAANTTKAPQSPPTPDIGAKFNSPIPEFDTNDSPNVSMPDFSSTAPDSGSDKHDSTPNTGNPSSATFGSDTRNSSSSTRDYSPPGSGRNRAASASTWTWTHRCGPFCNDFCPNRADHVAREIVEIDSDEEKEILGVNVKDGRGSGRKASGETTLPLRKASADRTLFRLALVRLPRRRAVVAAGGGGAPSPAKSVGSAYYTASETSCS